jgi:hypothetical protein
MNSQLKQAIAFVVAAGITAAVLIWLSISPRMPSGGSVPTIPQTEEQREMSSVSKSLSEMLPNFFNVPMGDVVVVPSGQGWKVVVFGVVDGGKKDAIVKTAAEFASKNSDVGSLEVVFDSPPK